MTAPLVAHSLVTPPSGQATRVMLFLHGVFGSGANWRSFARRFVAAPVDGGAPWAAALVDLRKHGASQDVSPPHTVTSAAEDLIALEAALPCPVAGVVGHSFGGKVALEYVRLRSGDLDVAYVLDATPGARPTQRGSEIITTVLHALEAAPAAFPSREAFVAKMAEAGISRDLGQWLAMNLRSVPTESGTEQYRLRLELPAIRELLADYWERDLWAVLESPPGRVVQHVVIGGTSRVFSDDDKERVARAAAASNGRVRVHVLPRAGHWVHVDDPDGLFAILTSR